MKVGITVITKTFEPSQTGEKVIQLNTFSQFKVQINPSIVPLVTYAKKGFNKIVFSDVFINFEEPQDKEININVSGINEKEQDILLGTITGTLRKTRWWELINPVYTEYLKK